MKFTIYQPKLEPISLQEQRLFVAHENGGHQGCLTAVA
jgi:hypothetical protein